jgi:hypothetical protein
MTDNKEHESNNKKSPKKKNASPKKTHQEKSHKEKSHKEKSDISDFFKIPDIDIFDSDSEEENALINMQNERENLFEDFNFPSFHNFFENYFDSDKNHKKFSEKMKIGDKGCFYSKSYVSHTNYNENGEPEKITYQTNSINQYDEKGHNIREKHEAYKNTKDGIEKLSNVKMLNGKGLKIIKEINNKTGEKKEHNVFKGIEEKDMEKFNKDYEEYSEKNKFKKHYEALENMFVGKKHKRNEIGDGEEDKKEDHKKEDKKEEHKKEDHKKEDHKKEDKKEGHKKEDHKKEDKKEDHKKDEHKKEDHKKDEHKKEDHKKDEHKK